jgi:hypothetical protein
MRLHFRRITGVSRVEEFFEGDDHRGRGGFTGLTSTEHCVRFDCKRSRSGSGVTYRDLEPNIFAPSISSTSIAGRVPKGTEPRFEFQIPRQDKSGSNSESQKHDCGDAELFRG